MHKRLRLEVTTDHVGMKNRGTIDLTFLTASIFTQLTQKCAVHMDYTSYLAGLYENEPKAFGRPEQVSVFQHLTKYLGGTVCGEGLISC